MSAAARTTARVQPARVMRVSGLSANCIERLTARYGLEACAVATNTAIPGSHWGESEAGLIANRLYLRPDTPAHSLLHELSHYVCMTAQRRARLDTDAGGDDLEECAVCYLQVLLADELSPFGRERCLDDMASWGYSFREGTARAWFSGDGLDARKWLIDEGLIDQRGHPTWILRGEEVQAAL